MYIHWSDAAQHLNFDFVLENRSGEDLLINKIELLVFDKTGALVRREFYDEYGRPAMEIGPGTTIEKHSTKLLFNPFYSFSVAVPWASCATHSLSAARTGGNTFEPK